MWFCPVISSDGRASLLMVYNDYNALGDRSLDDGLPCLGVVQSTNPGDVFLPFSPFFCQSFAVFFPSLTLDPSFSIHWLLYDEGGLLS